MERRPQSPKALGARSFFVDKQRRKQMAGLVGYRRRTAKKCPALHKLCRRSEGCEVFACSPSRNGRIQLVSRGHARVVWQDSRISRAARARFNRSRPFFFNDTATPEIYTLSLHDALPI